MRYVFLFFSAACLFLSPPTAFGQAMKRGGPQDLLLIKEGTIFTMTQEEAFKGDILVRGGKISALGRELKIPAKIPTINARGKTILPGFVDANSVFLLHSSRGYSSRADADVLDEFDYFKADEMELALSRGITTLALSPHSGDGIRGQCAVIKLIPDVPLEKMMVKRSFALKAGLGTGNLGRPIARLRAVASLDKKFKQAKDYEEAWDTYKEELEEYLKKIKPEEKKEAEKEDKEKEVKKPPEKEPDKKEGEPEKKEGDELEKKGSSWAPGEEEKKKDEKGKDKKKEDEPKKPKEPTFVMEKEILVKAMNGEMDLHLEAHRASDILAALDLKEKYHLDMVLVGCTEGALVAEEIEAAGVPVILGPVVRPRRGEPNEYFNHRPKSASIFAQKGIAFALASSGRAPDETRFLRLNAALAAGAGLEKERALEAVTIRAAEILGVDDRLGTIEKGKDADLVIMSRHPFDSDARVELVLVNGRTVFDRRK